MAFHHHLHHQPHHHLHHQPHHHLHHFQQQLLSAASDANFCCSTCCSYPSPTTEPLLQATASQLLHHQQQQQTGACCQAQTLKTHQNHKFQQKNRNFPHQQEEKFVLSSLLSRIDALETHLQNLSLTSTSFSLRDTAARVIQTHFRSFLVRRSRTLGQLKELALIKSNFNSLKLSVSKKSHFNLHVVSQRAVDLLLKLDSIQGRDPMIRDGKRSISKDLIKFLEFVDGFAVKRYEISTKAAKNVRFVGNSSKSRVLRSNGADFSMDQAEVVSKLRDKIAKIHQFSRVIKNEQDEDVELERFHELLDDEDEVNPRVSRNKNVVFMKRQVGDQPRLKKSVTFAENGNVYRFIGNGSGKSISSDDGTLTNESDTYDDKGEGVEVEEIKGSPKETEDDEAVYFENGRGLQSSDEERNPRGSVGTGGRYEAAGEYEVEAGQFTFSAPLPAKMQPRADVMKKRNELKIVA